MRIGPGLNQSVRSGLVWSAELLRLEPSTNRRKQGSKPRTLSWIFFPPPTAAEKPEAVLRPQKKAANKSRSCPTPGSWTWGQS